MSDRECKRIQTFLNNKRVTFGSCFSIALSTAGGLIVNQFVAELLNVRVQLGRHIIFCFGS